MIDRFTGPRWAGTLLAAIALLAAAQVPVHASTAQDRMPNVVPSTATPDVNDGTVFSIGQVGNRIFLGGNFTSATSRGSATATSRQNVLAFDSSTGVVDSGFTPTVDGEVDAIIPGPGNTVYLAGAFKTVNGVATRLALLDANTGATVAGWKPSTINGATTSMVLSDGSLFVGGTFTKVGGVTHQGIVAVDPRTGGVQNWFDAQLTGRHGAGSAKGAMGAKKIDVDPSGKHLVVIGNFTAASDSAGSEDRDQIARFDLAPTSVSLNRSWRTLGYTAQCFNWAFDAYIRDVKISPDGRYFVVVATGGSGTNTDGSRSLCDTAARFEIDGSGSNVQPTWVDYTGQDSLWSVEVTGTAIYVGGHQRWLNNSNGYDYAGSGAVPRAGLGALDPENGMPLAWNPGRNPRGAGAFALLATSTGLYVGSDTSYIGNFKYKRQRIAYFPLAGGATLAPNNVGTLPGTVYTAGGFANARPDVLYRVDAGGGTVGATDGGPDWAADVSDPSPVRNSGSNAAGWDPSATFDSTIPAGTPAALFDSERWDPGSKGDGQEMQWAFPVPVSTDVKVRLYFANRYTGTSQPGQRVFDVAVEGKTVLNSFDIIPAAGGDQRATMREFNVTSDGMINIDLGHQVENPLINAIEILQTNPAPPPPTVGSGLVARHVDAADHVGSATTMDETTMDWSRVRGAFMVNGELYYGKSDGSFNERTFDGSTLGAEVAVDPYNDPTWSNLSTGSGNTYRGVAPTLYQQMANVTSMFYSGGRIYYTMLGRTGMQYRYFTPDSGVIGSEEFGVTDGFDWSNIAGAFVTGNVLYYATKSDGVLHAVGWAGGMAVGSSRVVDASNNWATRGMFLLADPTRINQPPVAALVVSCSPGTLACSFDASGSRDPDGSIASYDWDFGDGSTQIDGTATVAHTYASTGARTATVTVTDNDGAVGTASVTATPSAASQPIQFRGQTTFSASGTSMAQVGVPASVAPGDAVVIFHSYNTNSIVSDDPIGWTLVKAVNNSTAITTKIYSKVATASDPGSTVTFNYSGPVKASATLTAYSGTSLTDPIGVVASSGDVGSSGHLAPTVVVPAEGSWVLTYWVDKSSTAATAWTVPSELSLRATTFGSGAGSVSTQLADSGGSVPSGSYAGKTATVNTVSTKGMSLTVSLNPAT